MLSQRDELFRLINQKPGDSSALMSAILKLIKQNPEVLKEKSNDQFKSSPIISLLTYAFTRKRRVYLGIVNKIIDNYPEHISLIDVDSSNNTIMHRVFWYAIQSAEKDASLSDAFIGLCKRFLSLIKDPVQFMEIAKIRNNKKSAAFTWGETFLDNIYFEYSNIESISLKRNEIQAMLAEFISANKAEPQKNINFKAELEVLLTDCVSRDIFENPHLFPADGQTLSFDMWNKLNPKKSPLTSVPFEINALVHNVRVEKLCELFLKYEDSDENVLFEACDAFLKEDQKKEAHKNIVIEQVDDLVKTFAKFRNAKLEELNKSKLVEFVDMAKSEILEKQPKKIGESKKINPAPVVVAPKKVIPAHPPAILTPEMHIISFLRTHLVEINAFSYIAEAIYENNELTKNQPGNLIVLIYSLCTDAMKEEFNAVCATANFRVPCKKDAVVIPFAIDDPVKVLKALNCVHLGKGKSYMAISNFLKTYDKLLPEAQKLKYVEMWLIKNLNNLYASTFLNLAELIYNIIPVKDRGVFCNLLEPGIILSKQEILDAEDLASIKDEFMIGNLIQKIGVQGNKLIEKALLQKKVLMCFLDQEIVRIESASIKNEKTMKSASFRTVLAWLQGHDVPLTQCEHLVQLTHAICTVNQSGHPGLYAPTDGSLERFLNVCLDNEITCPTEVVLSINELLPLVNKIEAVDLLLQEIARRNVKPGFIFDK